MSDYEAGESYSRAVSLLATMLLILVPAGVIGGCLSAKWILEHVAKPAILTEE